jgi:hypothetical protein
MTKDQLSDLLLAATHAVCRAEKLREDWATEAAWNAEQTYFKALRDTLSMEEAQ